MITTIKNTNKAERRKKDRMVRHSRVYTGHIRIVGLCVIFFLGSISHIFFFFQIPTLQRELSELCPGVLKRPLHVTHLSCRSLHTATITSRFPKMAIRITAERNVSSTTFSTDPKPSLELEDMHAHKHAYTHTHTHTNMHIHTTHMQTHICMHMYTHTRSYRRRYEALKPKDNLVNDNKIIGHVVFEQCLMFFKVIL